MNIRRLIYQTTAEYTFFYSTDRTFHTNFKQFKYRSMFSNVSCSVMSNCLRPHGQKVAHQSPLSVEFSRREYWSGLPFPSPGNLPDPRMEPRSLALQADSLPTEPPGKPIVFTNHNTIKLEISAKNCTSRNLWPHGILQARIPEWVAIPFSRGSSQSRDWTHVYRIAGRLFTSWAAREA